MKPLLIGAAIAVVVIVAAVIGFAPQDGAPGAPGGPETAETATEPNDNATN